MVEPRRAEFPAPLEAADRDSRAELLLVEGLDRYFEGRYDDAIHLWTRVLFLDRSHARARAYIDRARTALAERQRHAEELLQASQDLIDQGRAADARDLLTKAVQTSGDDARSEGLRAKLERLERAARATSTGATTSPVSTASPRLTAWPWTPRSRPVVSAVAVVAIAAGLWLVLRAGWPAFTYGSGEQLAAATAPVRWPVLSSADAALVRAHTLYSRGRLAQALAALDGVTPSSPRRAEADQLRIEIQRILLAGIKTSPTKAGGR